MEFADEELPMRLTRFSKLIVNEFLPNSVRLPNFPQIIFSRRTIRAVPQSMQKYKRRNAFVHCAMHENFLSGANIHHFCEPLEIRWLWRIEVHGDVDVGH